MYQSTYQHNVWDALMVWWDIPEAVQADLVQEGHLSAQTAHCIAACIGQRTDPSGQWRKQP